MTWAPDATVTIGGTDFTGEALETVRIHRGRDTVYDEPRAGYCILELIDLTGAGLDFDVLDTLTVTLDDSATLPVTVFTGKVSDWSAVLYDTGHESGTAKSIVTVIAVAPLASLNRRAVAAAGLAAQKDGTRILNLVAAGLASSWEETPGTWATVASASTTWGTFDAGFDSALIDTPGVFDIAALAAEPGGYNPLTEGYLTAVSGRGILWDTADGYVAYADANRRETSANAGYLELPGSVINAGQLTTSSQFSDIVNRVAIDYDGGRVQVSDAESILTFGVLARQFTTNLAGSTAAEAWGVDYIEDHAGESINLPSVTSRLDGIADDTLRDALIDIDVNDPVFLTGLPATLGVTALPAFVEGVHWAIDRERVSLTMNVSDAALSIGSVRWENAPATLRWNQVAATLTWEDARSF